MKTPRLLTYLLSLALALSAPAADVKISELPADTAMASGDYFPFVDISASATKKITLANVKVSLGLVWADLGSTPTTLAGYGITDAAALSHTHAFASLTSKPTTLAGFGITDAAALSHTHSFASLTSLPSTLAGYGITDAAALSHTHSFASLTSKPTTLSGYGITDGQPLDGDLTSIAALTTTTFGRSLLTQADAAATRTTLSLGSAATLTAGTAANNLVQLDGTGKLPAVDGSALTNLPGGGGGSSAMVLYNVKDAPYGALGDGATDDTDAINAAIAACVGDGGGTVYFPPGHYVCSGALDATTNSVITFPVTLRYDGQPVRVELIGSVRGWHDDNATIKTGGTVLDFTNAPAASGTDAAAIAGAASATAATTDFNCVDVFIDRMNIILKKNPDLHGINMRNTERFSSGDVLGIFALMNGGLGEPTHGTRGIITSRYNNNVVGYIGQTQIGGFAYGIEAGEHLDLRGPYIGSCGTGLLIQEGNKLVSGNARIEYCANFVELPASVAANPKLKLVIDGEPANTGDWRGFAYAVKDVNSVGRGRVDCALTLAGTTTAVRPLKLGGKFIAVDDLTAVVADLGSYTATEIARWNLEDTSDSTGSYTLTNHGTVTFTGGGKTGSKANFNGSNQWLSSSLSVAGADFSASGWAKFAAGANQVVAAQYGAYPASRWELVYLSSTGALRFDVLNASGGDEYVDSEVLDATVPHFFVIEYQHELKTIRMKVDDGEWTTLVLASAMATGGTTPAFTLGADLQGGGGTGFAFLHGWLDSFRVHSALIDDRRAHELWDGGLPGDRVVDTDVAHFDAAGVGGNGTPGAPYGPGQGQTAYDAGFRVFEIGENCAIGNITITSGTPTLKFRGHGSGSTVGTISNVGATGSTASPGGDGRAVTIVELGFRSVFITGVTTTGGAGGVSDNNVSGGTGGAGGTLTINGPALIGTVAAEGGVGGLGASDQPGGTGGTGGDVIMDGPAKVTTTLSVYCGQGGGDAGSGPGMVGTHGNLALSNGPDVPTPTSPATIFTVHGAIINGTFFTNTYP